MQDNTFNKKNNMNTEKNKDLIKYLNDLLVFRETEWKQINFNQEEYNLYSTENEKIKSCIKELEKQNNNINNVEEELKTLKSKYAYLAADFDNYKKRSMKEKQNIISIANKNILNDMLNIVDDFDRVLISCESNANGPIFDGVKLIYNNVIKILESEGCRRIDVKIGDVFDVNIHEAIGTMGTEDSNIDSQTIVKIVQSGWMLNDKLFRAAKVIVRL